MHFKVIKRRVLKTRRKPERNTWLSAVRLQERGKSEEDHCQKCMLTGISRMTEKKDKESCRGTVKRCILIMEEPREVQDKRIEYFKKNGDQKFTDEGRKAEITVDLVLQSRARMSENKVNGPDDAKVSDMIKQLPLKKVYIVTRCFQERFMGQMEAPSSWKIVKLVFLRKPDAELRKGIRSYRAIALTSVMSKWYAS